jgi:multiple sugar transport system substrate-binding protein
MDMKKSLFALMCAFAILSQLLIACTPAAEPTKPPAAPAATAKPAEPTKAPAAPAEPTKAPAPAVKKIALTFYQRGYVEGGTDAASMTTAKAVDLFMKNNPNVTVSIVGIPWTTEGDTKLEAALAAKSGINVFRVTSPNLPRYAKQGVLSNIEPFMTAEDKADFYPSGFQVATIDGKAWAWPLWVTAIATYANLDYFKERGVEAPTIEKPWTWDQFVDACKKLTYKKADGTQVYGFTSASMAGTIGFSPLYYIDGGRILSADGKKFVQNQPEAVSALQKVADLALVHKCTPPDFGATDQAATRAQFKDRKTVAMFMDPPGFIPDVETAKMNFAIIPPPTGDMKKLVTNGAFGLYAVVNVSDQDTLKAAHDLGKYLTGSQVAKDIAGWQLAPGLRRSNTSYGTEPNRKVIERLVEFGVYEAPVSVSSEVGVTQYGAAIQAILLGKKTTKQAMDELAPLYQKELDSIK